jgi:hypothetical protein
MRVAGLGHAVTPPRARIKESLCDKSLFFDRGCEGSALAPPSKNKIGTAQSSLAAASKNVVYVSLNKLKKSTKNVRQVTHSTAEIKDLGRKHRRYRHAFGSERFVRDEVPDSALLSARCSSQELSMYPHRRLFIPKAD